MSFFGALTLIFIVLKLVDVIAWSWWWVTAPLWGPVVLVILVVVIVLLVGLCK
jgi:hypothetical protein